ncbi:LacI family DNA-binding transcriptional regulator [Paenibacillus sp. P26]|nr:LacI family DNA-binding transcriptional regulator [Paenibacillus sp. P26]
MKIKMEDIARMANVSKSAVSLALSGKPGISEETRAKILRIVKESGYLPRSMVKADKVYGISNTPRFVACTNSGIVLEQYYKRPSSWNSSMISRSSAACADTPYSSPPSTAITSRRRFRHWKRSMNRTV